MKAMDSPACRDLSAAGGSVKLDTFCPDSKEKARVGHLSPVPD